MVRCDWAGLRRFKKKHLISGSLRGVFSLCQCQYCIGQSGLHNHRRAVPQPPRPLPTKPGSGSHCGRAGFPLAIQGPQLPAVPPRCRCQSGCAAVRPRHAPLVPSTLRWCGPHKPRVPRVARGRFASKCHETIRASIAAAAFRPAPKSRASRGRLQQQGCPAPPPGAESPCPAGPHRRGGDDG